MWLCGNLIAQQGQAKLLGGCAQSLAAQRRTLRLVSLAGLHGNASAYTEHEDWHLKVWRLLLRWQARQRRRADSALTATLETLGTKYGGWNLCTASNFFNESMWPLPLRVVSAGAGEDISFEEALLGRLQWRASDDLPLITVLDPTPRAQAYVMSRGVMDEERLSFLPVGLTGRTKVMNLRAQKAKAFVSLLSGEQPLSQVAEQKFDDAAVGITALLLSLWEFFSITNTCELDVVKMDIEGAEFDIFGNLLFVCFFFSQYFL